MRNIMPKFGFCEPTTFRTDASKRYPPIRFLSWKIQDIISNELSGTSEDNDVENERKEILYQPEKFLNCPVLIKQLTKVRPFHGFHSLPSTSSEGVKVSLWFFRSFENTSLNFLWHYLREWPLCPQYFLYVTYKCPLLNCALCMCGFFVLFCFLRYTLSLH